MGFSQRRIVRAMLVCLLFGGMPACGDQERIRIGFLGGITGRAAGLGTSGRDGFLLAIEQANAAGGVNGSRLEAVIRDDQMNETAAVSALQELRDNKVAAIIGPMTSQIAITVVPAANRARLPLISPTVSTNQLSGLDDYFLRVYYSNAQAADMLAGYLASSQGRPKLAAVYDRSNRAYTEDWLQDFRRSYGQHGGELLVAIPFDSADAPPFETLTTQLLESKPGSILLLANAVDSAMLAQQLAKHNAKLPLYATGWSYTDDLLQLGGKSVEGLTIIQSADQESPDKAYRDFARLYMERFGAPPNFPALHAYDATCLLVAALKQAGRSDGPQLKNTLLGLMPQDGVQGPVAFDRFGDLRAPKLHLAVVRNGAFHSLH